VCNLSGRLLSCPILAGFRYAKNRRRIEIDVSLGAVHRSRSLLLGSSRKGASSKMAAATQRRPKSIWEETCQRWESPIVGKLLHASSGPAGESMSQRATCSGVRSLQFLWVLPGTHYVHALIWPRFHGALALNNAQGQSAFGTNTRLWRAVAARDGVGFVGINRGGPRERPQRLPVIRRPP